MTSSLCWHASTTCIGNIPVYWRRIKGAYAALKIDGKYVSAPTEHFSIRQTRGIHQQKDRFKLYRLFPYRQNNGREKAWGVCLSLSDRKHTTSARSMAQCLFHSFQAKGSDANTPKVGLRQAYCPVSHCLKLQWRIHNASQNLKTYYGGLSSELPWASSTHESRSAFSFFLARVH